MSDKSANQPEGHKRRKRYRGTHPRRFDQKYKELDPERNPETIASIIASGKTPAGQHRPILVDEVIGHLAPEPGETGVDATLGYGGHSEALLSAINPGGRLLALDVDSQQLPTTESRLRNLGHSEDVLICRRSNYAGVARALAELSWNDGVDFLLADLGLSSMQIDNPTRGFSYKHKGPLDMRMNPQHGVTAAKWLEGTTVELLTQTLLEGGDEPNAERIAEAVMRETGAGRMTTTRQLRLAVENACPSQLDEDDRSRTAARVFQAIRIVVNDEFHALDAFLAQLPFCLRPEGRVAVLSFHSGEDRRVKHHFRDGFRGEIYQATATKVIRPTADEIASNSRAASAKLRWAIRAR